MLGDVFLSATARATVETQEDEVQFGSFYKVYKTHSGMIQRFSLHSFVLFFSQHIDQEQRRTRTNPQVKGVRADGDVNGCRLWSVPSGAGPGGRCGTGPDRTKRFTIGQERRFNYTWAQGSRDV